MPKVKEFTVTIEDKPGALGHFFGALAESGLNILAFQSFVEGRESLARLLVDDPLRAKQLLGKMDMIFEETEAVTVKLPNGPGALGRAGLRLGQEKINIDYSYCGVDPRSGAGMLVFGVDNPTRAAIVLDELAAEGTK